MDDGSVFIFTHQSEDPTQLIIDGDENLRAVARIGLDYYFLGGYPGDWISEITLVDRAAFVLFEEPIPDFPPSYPVPRPDRIVHRDVTGQKTFLTLSPAIPEEVPLELSLTQQGFLALWVDNLPDLGEGSSAWVVDAFTYWSGFRIEV